MDISKVSTNFRLDEVLHDKTKIIASREKRSINSQMEYFVLKGIEEYEKTHEEIVLSEK